MRTTKLTRRKPSGDALAAALAQLGVHFVTGSNRVSGTRLASHPDLLFAGLAEQDEARLRLGIIPLLLRHPELAAVVPDAVKQVSRRRRDVIKLYFTAALLLQRKYAVHLTQLLGSSLPITDRYSRELGIPIQGDPDTRLRMLAHKQRERSGLALNWLGTYEHAAERFVRQLEFIKPRAMDH